MNIDSALKSDIHLKIIRFFFENQGSIDTPRGVATWIREDRSKVQKTLDELARLDILEAHRVSSTTGYTFTQDSAIAARIEKFLKKHKSS